MPDRTAQRDGIDAAVCPGPKAEIDVLAAVDIGFVEPAELLPECARDQHAGARHGGNGAHRAQPSSNEIGPPTDMYGFAGDANHQPRVIDEA